MEIHIKDTNGCTAYAVCAKFTAEGIVIKDYGLKLWSILDHNEASGKVYPLAETPS